MHEKYTSYAMQQQKLTNAEKYLATRFYTCYNETHECKITKTYQTYKLDLQHMNLVASLPYESVDVQSLVCHMNLKII
jgi:hypothetical protein